MDTGFAYALLQLALGAAFWALPAHARTRPENLLSHPARRRVSQLVGDRPGAKVPELSRLVGLKGGTMRHHLVLLERAGVLKAVGAGRERGFFVPAVPPDLAAKILALRTGRAIEVARQVVRNPGIRQNDLLMRIGMTRKVLRRCIANLSRHSLIEETKVMRRCHYHPSDFLLRVAPQLTSELGTVPSPPRPSPMPPPPT